jgi:hypothetical protein
MDAVQLVESLDPVAIRTRLDQLRGEQQALRALLRAALARQRPRGQGAGQPEAISTPRRGNRR